jgi:hypothetical protein
MPRFEVTKRGANGLEIGAVVEAEHCPAWLTNKCRVLPDEKPKALEVATPQRGRPPKEKEK